MSDVVESSSVVVARQPIFDRHNNVFAYELLFRDAAEHTHADLSNCSGDTATSRVINHAFLELGMERVIGRHVAFVNLTRNFILNDAPLPFSQDRVVLEVLEDIDVDNEVIDSLHELSRKGFTIALDDFIYHDNLLPLVDIADIIKIDILALSDEELRQHIDLLSCYNVKLLAEKVETQDQFARCLELGFEYFQGFFFSHPEVIQDKPIPESQFQLLRILEKLQDPLIEFEELETMIKQDVGLSYKLLRLLNSAAVGIPSQVDSIRKGLMMLGLEAIRAWTTLIMMSDINSESAELMNTALIRAKMSEDLADVYGCSRDSSFLTGLFSAIDTMLSRPMQQIIEPMPLSSEIKLALIDRAGNMGELLDTVISYKRGDWDNIRQDKVSLQQLSTSYVTATEWTIQTRQTLTS